MKTVVLGAMMVLGLAASASAQTQVTSAQSFAWDYPAADIVTVSRFEIKVDTGSYLDAGKTPLSNVANSYYYQIPAMVSGNHQVVARACNIAGCSVDTPPLLFVFVAGVPNAVPGPSLRIIQTPLP